MYLVGLREMELRNLLNQKFQIQVFSLSLLGMNSLLSRRVLIRSRIIIYESYAIKLHVRNVDYVTFPAISRSRDNKVKEL